MSAIYEMGKEAKNKMFKPIIPKTLEYLKDDDLSDTLLAKIKAALDSSLSCSGAYISDLTHDGVTLRNYPDAVNIIYIVRENGTHILPLHPTMNKMAADAYVQDLVSIHGEENLSFYHLSNPFKENDKLKSISKKEALALIDEVVEARLSVEDITKILNESKENEETPDFSKKILQNLNLSNLDFTGANFCGAKIEDVNFERSTLDNANFCKAQFRNVYFDVASLKNANFVDANVFRTSFVRSDLSNANFQYAKMNTIELFMADGLDKAIVDGDNQKTFYEAFEISGMKKTHPELLGPNCS